MEEKRKARESEPALQTAPPKQPDNFRLAFFRIIFPSEAIAP
jgi:hypothetical protein